MSLRNCRRAEHCAVTLQLSTPPLLCLGPSEATRLPSHPTNFMSQPMTIHRIPFDIIAMILEELRRDPQSLFRLALIHSSCTPEALELLYRDIKIKSNVKAVRLANENIRHHFEKTETLHIARMEWNPAVENVLQACHRLKELHLGATLSLVPLNILHHSSLTSLFSLNYSTLQESDAP